MTVAGIDVAYKSFVVATNNKSKSKQLENTPSGHTKLVEHLRAAKTERVCIEATGTYHLDLAIALHYANIDIMVVNPRAAKNFAEAMASRTKTDAVDALLLCEFAQRMPFEAWQKPSANILAIRAVARRLSALNKLKTDTKNQRHAASQTKSTPSYILDEFEETLSHFESQIQRLRQHALETIKADQRLLQAFDLLISTTGIAENSAVQLMGELLVLPDGMGPKQWVAMAGLDPRHNQSGSSVNKKPRLSKTGNRYLRHALYMPALSATRHEPNVKAYYQHLINNRGLKKIQAICAVMRKLLHAIHGMFKTNTPFDGTRFYQEPNTET